MIAVTDTESTQRIALDALRDVIAQHAILTELAKDFSERAGLLAAEIRTALGEAVVGTVDGVDLVLSPFRVNTHLDKQVIQAADPALYERAVRTTPYRPLINKTDKGKTSPA